MASTLDGPDISIYLIHTLFYVHLEYVLAPVKPELYAKLFNVSLVYIPPLLVIRTIW
jgi:hypothetical protein